MEEIRKHLLIEVHHCCREAVVKRYVWEENKGESTAATDSDEEEELAQREEKIMKMMMDNNYPDSEIDKLLESLKKSGSNDILSGEFIENDIRLSEAIREAIEDIKFA